MQKISRVVWILSLISLFTDMASEMLYPIMPIYLKSVGFSIITIGILEGFAEATAGLSKGYFGKWSDALGKRVPFVQFGYGLSAIAKPLMAVVFVPFWIFSTRTLERLGKGIRTGARDAILSDEATPETKGKIFGFHRSMDTFGAVLGPIIALVYLYYFPASYRTLFFIAFVPGLFAVLCSALLKESSKTIAAKDTKVSLFSFIDYWSKGPQQYRKLLYGFLLFALFNSSDVFLLLKAKEAGLDDTMVIVVYIFYNLVYAIFALPLGMLADKIGLKNIFIFGLILFAIAYGGMSMQGLRLPIIFILFFLYGIYAASTEGISKAWISNVIPKENTATAIGTFAGLQSICTLFASSIAGYLWYAHGAGVTFFVSALAAIIVAIYLYLFEDNFNKQV